MSATLFLRPITRLVTVLTMMTLVVGCKFLAPKSAEQVEKDRKSEERSRRAKIFDGRPDLLTDFGKLPEKTQLSKTPYFKGKVVVLKKGSTFSLRADDSRWVFLDGIYAETPEEIQTVVLIDIVSVAGPNYSDPDGSGVVASEGNRWNITLVDRTIGAVVFRKTFEPTFSSEIKVKSNSRGAVSANDLEMEVVKFLEGVGKR
ncbi:MAG: hypothetical protein AAB288_11920 [Acidobacteriota bacterium]